MAAATMSGNSLDSLSQPPSQASSPSATATAFQNQQSRVVAALQNARSMPATPTTLTSHSTSPNNSLEPPSGVKYAEFLRTWNDTHVSRWLTDIKCAHHSEKFKANDIRGDVLLELEQSTLKEMGVASIGDRLRILNAVKALRQKCSTRRIERLSMYGSARESQLSLGDHSLSIHHARNDSASSPTSTRSHRRLDHGRPAPLQLNPNAVQQANLPGLERDALTAPDSARSLRPPHIQQPPPLPPSSSTPHTSSSSSRQVAHIPPAPRGQPPPPPPLSSSSRSGTRNVHPISVSGRRTPTQTDALPDYTSQPLPPAPGLLTPQSANIGAWSGYGLPPDPRANLNGKTPTTNRSQSPLPAPPPRTASRSPNPSAHGRNVSTSSIVANTTAAPKLSARPSTAGNHPYSQGLQPPPQQANNTILSPIAESFISTNGGGTPSASPSPPTAYAVGRGPFARPNTPGHNANTIQNANANANINITPSLVDLRRKLVKFQLAEEGHSCTINVEDCAGGIEVLEKALKKFGKLGGRQGGDGDGGMTYAGTDDGGLNVDGWGVYLDWRHDSRPGTPLSEAQLLAVCHAPPDDPAREHGLTLRRTTPAAAAGKIKRSKALAQIFGEHPPVPGQRNSPTSPLFNGVGTGPRISGNGNDDEYVDLGLASPGFSASQQQQQQQLSAKAMKRASSISVLSGLGVHDPERALESPSSPTQPGYLGPGASSIGGSGPGNGNNNGRKTPPTPSSKKGPSKLRNFFGQRPPSELIATHLHEYFPFAERKLLDRTARNSMLRGGSFSKRDSTMSFAPPPGSRFSVSTMDSQRRSSHRTSTASSIPPAVPEKVPRRMAVDNEHENGSNSSMMDPPPRVSISISRDDGDSVDLESEEDEEGGKRMSRASLLPPVNLSFESFSESMSNLTGGSTASTATRLTPSSRRPMSVASKRMSYVKELRSKRDTSDTGSIMTMDEITAEVESRQGNAAVNTVADDASLSGWTQVTDGDDENETPAAPADVPPEGAEEEEEEDELEVEEEDDDEEYDEDEEEFDEDEEQDETGNAIESNGLRWIKGALIGAGSFGKVYLGMDATTGLLMAVKQVDLPSAASINKERKQQMLNALEREMELLKDLEHEHIVQYLYSSADEEHFNIFLEYVPGGSLTALLRNYGAFEEPLVRNFLRQILEGLDYVHERGIVHRDIKGANILVDNKGGIKISDFGISKKLEDNLMPGNRLHRPSLQGSVFWMAPEVVKQTTYTKKADIWSVGCLIVEMLTGEHPWAQLNQMQAIFKIGSAAAKPAIPSDISADAHNFLDLCFELDHEVRPSAGDLLKHPWLAKKPGKASKAAMAMKETAAP